MGGTARRRRTRRRVAVVRPRGPGAARRSLSRLRRLGAAVPRGRARRSRHRRRRRVPVNAPARRPGDSAADGVPAQAADRRAAPRPPPRRRRPARPEAEADPGERSTAARAEADAMLERAHRQAEHDAEQARPTARRAGEREVASSPRPRRSSPQDAERRQRRLDERERLLAEEAERLGRAGPAHHASPKRDLARPGGGPRARREAELADGRGAAPPRSWSGSPG